MLTFKSVVSASFALMVLSNSVSGVTSVPSVSITFSASSTSAAGALSSEYCRVPAIRRPWDANISCEERPILLDGSEAVEKRTACRTHAAFMIINDRKEKELAVV